MTDHIDTAQDATGQSAQHSPVSPPRYGIFPLTGGGYFRVEWPQDISSDGVREMDEFFTLLISSIRRGFSAGENK